MLTTQKQVRRQFWLDYPHVPRRRIKDYSGQGTMHCTDTRCAFVDFVDALQRAGTITEDLAQRVTL